jgi:hypothetical protein
MSPLLQSFLVIIAAALGIASYVPYVHGILVGRTKPHLFTWAIWGALTAIGAGVQFQAGAVTSGVITAMSTVGCVVVSVLAVQRGERRIVAADWFCLGGALAALLWWRLAKDPLTAVVFIIIVDVFGFFPTVRKSWSRPHEETVSIYALNVIRYAIGIATAGTGGLTVWLYPAYVAASQGAFALLLLALRRRR